MFKEIVMKVLFLSSGIPNYVTDGLFHGLHSVESITLVDVPRNDVMYKNATADMLAKTGSRGATLYGLLPLESDTVRSARTYWQRDIESFDIIVITDISETADLFYSLYKKLGKKATSKLCIVDGYDIPSRFPFYNIRFHLKYFKRYFFFPLSEVAYFKREYKSYNALFGFLRHGSGWLSKFIESFGKKPANILPISMSIPQEYIEFLSFSEKRNRFVSYNVDEDLHDIFDYTASTVGEWKPLYLSSEMYLQDMRNAQFGITTKRKGWDCLRHYEYAAKGIILCFKNLHLKSAECAPFGLNNTNCIQYSSPDELMAKLENLDCLSASEMQAQTYAWICEHTTKQVAQRFLTSFTKYVNGLSEI